MWLSLRTETLNERREQNASELVLLVFKLLHMVSPTREGRVQGKPSGSCRGCACVECSCWLRAEKVPQRGLRRRELLRLYVRTSPSCCDHGGCCNKIMEVSKLRPYCIVLYCAVLYCAVLHPLHLKTVPQQGYITTRDVHTPTLQVNTYLQPTYSLKRPAQPCCTFAH